MDVDGTNPSFPRANPHGTVIIDYLHRGVLFGLFSGCLRVLPRAGSRSPSEEITRGCF